jgi:hypothetical protein
MRVLFEGGAKDSSAVYLLQQQLIRDIKYVLYDQFTLDSAGFKSESFQDAFVSVSVSALQVFQELSPLVN